MTLLEMLQTLNTKDVKVTVVTASEQLIIFYSQGIAYVENDISARNVIRWEMTGASSLTVEIEEAD